MSRFTEYDASAVDFILWYEQDQSGEDAEHRMIVGFQALLDSGLVWKLQGSYGRTAAALIKAGEITERQTVRRNVL